MQLVEALGKIWLDHGRQLGKNPVRQGDLADALGKNPVRQCDPVEALGKNPVRQWPKTAQESG